MKVKVYNQEGKEVGTTELPPEIFEVPFNADLVHQAVLAQRSNARRVIAHTKDRSEVRGGGKKPWRQKHTGRARHGSRRSPIWVGGGVTFGPTSEKNYKKNFNKKMKRKALFVALSSKAKDEEIILLDELKLKGPKTKEMAGILETMSTVKISPMGSKKGKSKISERRNQFLVIIPQKDEVVTRTNRNIPAAKALRADSLNVQDILSFRYLLMPKESVTVIKNTYGII